MAAPPRLNHQNISGTYDTPRCWARAVRWAHSPDRPQNRLTASSTIRPSDHPPGSKSADGQCGGLVRCAVLARTVLILAGAAVRFKSTVGTLDPGGRARRAARRGERCLDGARTAFSSALWSASSADGVGVKKGRRNGPSGTKNAGGYGPLNRELCRQSFAQRQRRAVIRPCGGAPVQPVILGTGVSSP